MDVSKVLADLRQERQQLDDAIMTLERLARGRGKRRGRPPKWLSGTASAASASTPPVPGAKRRGRPPGSKNKPQSAPSAD